MLEILSWAAVAALSVSYWFQIYKIHVHKEVRDHSLPFYWLLFIGFGLLGIQAYYEESVIFLAKQILTTIPTGIIIAQIYFHRRDHWYDESYSACITCKTIIEPDWKYCPDCGTRDTGLNNEISLK
jgi:uncharacterized protein with PQ loop repeat